MIQEADLCWTVLLTACIPNSSSTFTVPYSPALRTGRPVSPNAAYKINNLIQKGYVTKKQSPDDKREYHLYVTKKYIDYYNVSYRYLSTVMERIKNRFPEEDVAKLEEMLDIISNELMPELDPTLSARSDL